MKLNLHGDRKTYQDNKENEKSEIEVEIDDLFKLSELSVNSSGGNNLSSAIKEAQAPKKGLLATPLDRAKKDVQSAVNNRINEMSDEEHTAFLEEMVQKEEVQPIKVAPITYNIPSEIIKAHEEANEVMLGLEEVSLDNIYEFDSSEAFKKELQKMLIDKHFQNDYDMKLFSTFNKTQIAQLVQLYNFDKLFRMVIKADKSGLDIVANELLAEWNSKFEEFMNQIENYKTAQSENQKSTIQQTILELNTISTKIESGLKEINAKYDELQAYSAKLANSAVVEIRKTLPSLKKKIAQMPEEALIEFKKKNTRNTLIMSGLWILSLIMAFTAGVMSQHKKEQPQQITQKK